MTKELAEKSKAWPFVEARRILARLDGKVPKRGYVLFETGYGPSGLPHIGTFQEVVRTTMVRHALEVLMPNIETRLICFSDDLDGLRQVPDNIPNKDLIAGHMGRPLTQVPDPFSCHSSFGEHNNHQLKKFLDQFNFDYQFASATQYYNSGRFDSVLLRILNKYDEIVDVILPTLGPERRTSYSPFLPICPRNGTVLQVPITSRDVHAGTISYLDPETKEDVTVAVTGGSCKLQWKVDWAMRWVALGVDYEMSGKDLIESVKLSSRITRILGVEPPVNFTYELFLDENGEKISKSRGNGLAIEEWLRYAPDESLAYYLYQQPRAARRLYFDVIPKMVDEYYNQIAAYPKQDLTKQLANPVFHIFKDGPSEIKLPISFSLLLNLVAAANADSEELLMRYIERYTNKIDFESKEGRELKRLCSYAIRYFKERIAPYATYRIVDDSEREHLRALQLKLKELDTKGESFVKDIEHMIYDLGKSCGYADNLRDWFKFLYETLFGQSQGPRMGQFIALYGVDNMIALIDNVLKRK